MATQYSGNNMQLQYDPETQQWSYVNVAQNFIDTSTFSSTDPQFQYGDADNQNDQDNQDDGDPCPPGYRQVTLENGDKACMQIEEPIQDSGGREDRTKPPKPDPYQQNKESIESFFELKNEGKIDFNTYDPKTNLVEYNSDANQTTTGIIFAGLTGNLINSIDNALDEAELKRAGMLVEKENGGKFIDLRVVHDVMKTKVMNPGVPEGNVLANTPGYFGLDDTNNYYKDYLENMNIKKEDMKIFGSTGVGVMFDEMMKSENKFKTTKLTNQGFETFGNSYFFNGKRLDQAEVNKLIQSGVTNPNDIVNEIKKDESKYIVTKADSDVADKSILDDIDDAMADSGGDSGSDSGPGTPGYVAPGTGATGAPGRDYGSDAEDNRRRRQQNNQQFTKASQDAAAARQKTIAQRAKRGTMGSGGAFPGQKGGGAPGYN
jgi:hypothetical protein